MIKNIFIVGFGGMAGTILRYLVYLLFGESSFPFSTLFINITGSFLIGIIAGITARHIELQDWRLFLATGLCGGFTTFSAFSIECVQLVQQSRIIAAAGYIFISIVLGIAATFGGYLITR